MPVFTPQQFPEQCPADLPLSRFRQPLTSQMGRVLVGHPQGMQSLGCYVHPKLTALQQVVWRLQQGAALMIRFMTAAHLEELWGLLNMQCLPKWFVSFDLNAKKAKAVLGDWSPPWCRATGGPCYTCSVRMLLWWVTFYITLMWLMCPRGGNLPAESNNDNMIHN